MIHSPGREEGGGGGIKSLVLILKVASNSKQTSKFVQTPEHFDVEDTAD
jgi:hypothetical protein